MKIVYLYDGTPFIVDLNVEGEYVYPNDEYTEVPPPEGIYQPFYYDGNEWIGTSKEEWESNLPVDPEYPKEDTKDKEIDDMKKRIEELERLIQQLLQDTD